MQSVRRILSVCIATIALVLSITPSPAMAADFDDSTPLLCAFTRAVDCISESGCIETTLENLDLPPFFKVDFKSRIITDVEAIGGRTVQKKTRIKTLQHMGEMVVLQGIDLRGWTMLISQKSGIMTLTASDDDEAFVLFGACTKL